MSRQGPLGIEGRNSLDATAFDKFPVYLPPEIKFGEIKKALAASRQPLIVRAELQSNSTDKNRKITIKLPNKEVLDTRKGFLYFDVTLAVTGSTRRRLHSGVQCIFERIVVRAGTTNIYESKDYNRISAILFELMNDIDNTGDIGMAMGYGTQPERDAAGLVTTRYACPINSGLLASELLPTKDLATAIEIDLYLADPQTIVESDVTGVSAVITVDNVEFHIEKYTFDVNYLNFISEYISTNGLSLGFHEWERHQNTISTATTQNILINDRASSVNGMLNIWLPTATINDMTVNDRLITWTPNNLSTSQVIINSTPFPDEPIDLATGNRWIGYQGYLRWANKFHLSGILDKAAPITSTAYAVNRFVEFDDFEPYPEAPDNIINPFSTRDNAANTLKKLTFTVAPVNTFQLDTWIEKYTQVDIFKNGSITRHV